MSEDTLSSFSNCVDKPIDEYHDSSSYSSSNSDSSSSGSSTDEGYTSSVPGFPLEVIQEQLRMREVSGAGTSTSIPLSPPSNEVETVYSCAVGIPSKTDDRKLGLLRKWYQIPDDLNPRLPVCREWCCHPRLEISIYKAFLLGGLRLPLNAFARELLTRLGLGVCQFNPNVEICRLYASFVERGV